jgi:hypothetical protein
VLGAIASIITADSANLKTSASAYIENGIKSKISLGVRFLFHEFLYRLIDLDIWSANLFYPLANFICNLLFLFGFRYRTFVEM